jgi:hypothetical protein
MKARIGKVAALVVLGVLIGAGAVWARGNTSEISACVEPRTNYLKFGNSCGGQQLTWNIQGPQGPAGPKGDPGSAPAQASKAEVAARANLPDLKKVVGKPNLAALAKQKIPTAGVIALSAWHDEAVEIPSLLNALSNPSVPYSTVVAHLDVPAGKYVVVAKARALNLNTKLYLPDDTAGVLCSLVAGADYDMGNATHWNMLSLTVVHVFSKAGRIDLNCTGATINPMALGAVKITAIRVGSLKNVYVPTG